LLLKLPRLADPYQKPQVDSAGSLNGIKLARLHLKQEPVVIQRSLVLAAETHPLALAFDSNTGQVFPVEDMRRGREGGHVKRKRSPSREDSDSDLEWQLESLKRKINRKRAKKDAQKSDAMDEEKKEVKKEEKEDENPK
jgi:hypothetical protein